MQRTRYVSVCVGRGCHTGTRRLIIGVSLWYQASRVAKARLVARFQRRKIAQRKLLVVFMVARVRCVSRRFSRHVLHGNRVLTQLTTRID